MKKLAFRFSILLGVIASLICFMPNLSKSSAYAADASVESSFYLINEDRTSSYKSNVEAGVVSGYDSYKLGEENVSLVANANNGFNFVGWEIAKGIEAGVVGTVYSSSTAIKFGEVDVNFTISGNSKRSTLTINKVPSDLTVRAVFDYEFFNVEIDEDIINHIKTTEETLTVKLPDNSTTTVSVKYASKSGNQYSNVIVNDGKDIINCFYETLYFDGTLLYTLQNKTIAAATEQKINYTYGAFKLNEVADINFNIAIDEEENLETDEFSSIDSKHIDVQSFSSTGNVIVKKTNVITNNYYEITKDDYQRTSSFTIKTSVSNNFEISWTKHRLYLIDYTFSLLKNDNETPLTDVAEIAIISSQIATTDSYFKISNTRFLAKNSANQGRIPFGILCERTISKIVDGTAYPYYEFYSMAGSTDIKQSFSTFLGDEQIKFVYKPIEYYVSIQFVLWDNGEFEIKNDASLNKEDIIPLTRGESYTIEKGDLEYYDGYLFHAFSNTVEEVEANTSIDLTMDRDTPSNMVIYMIHKKLAYKIKVVDETGGKTLTKTNEGTPITIYPLSSMTATKNNENVLVKYGNNIMQNIYINDTFNIGDSFSIMAISSVGFKVALSLSDSFVYGNTSTLEHEITSEFINRYAKFDNVNNEYVIYAYLNAEYETYSLTYQIDKRYSGADLVLMADITANTSIENDERVKDIVIDVDTGSQLIVVENLKYFEIVTLTATAYQYGEDAEGNPVYYYLQYFTDGLIALNKTSTGNVHVCNYSVTEDRTITVVFSAPEANLTIVKTDIYSYKNVEVYQQNEETGEYEPVGPKVSEDNVFSVAGFVMVKFTNLNTIATGYYFTGFSLTSADGRVDASYLKENLQDNSQIIEIGAVPYTLTITLPEITYKVGVKQYGVGFSGENGEDPAGTKVVFGEEGGNKILFTNLTLSSNNLQFSIPKAGTYIYKAQFAGEDLEGFAQIQGANYALFSHLLTGEDFEILDPTFSGREYGVVYVDIDVYYQIVKYVVTINLTQNKDAYKYEDLTDVVSFDCSYADVEITKEENFYKFGNIPYGTQVRFASIIADNSGLVHNKWEIYSNGTIDAADTSKLTFDSLQDNKILKYSVNYTQYTINLHYITNQGSQVVTKNETLQEGNEFVNGDINTAQYTITVLDHLKIETNANKNLGFKFEGLYQEYIYTSIDEWNAIYNTLYVKDANSLKLNTNPNKEEGVTYYVKMTLEEGLNDYEDEQFLLQDYYINTGDSNKINIYVQYVYIEVKLAYTASVSEGFNLGIGDINLTPDDYATHEFKDGDLKINQDAYVNYSNGQIDLYVYMNDVVLKDGTYNLSLGVCINIVSCAVDGEVLRWNQNVVITNGYKVTINLQDIIPKLADDIDTLIFDVEFKVNAFTSKTTTNINGYNPDNTKYTHQFYTDTCATGKCFNIRANFGEGFGDSSASNSKYGILTDTQQFLCLRIFSFTFRGDYIDYFHINNFKVYNGSGELVPEKHYAEYGVSYGTQADQLVVYLRYIVPDVTIKFMVEASLSLNDNVNNIKLVDGRFVSNVLYDFPKDMVNKQVLTIGTNQTSNISMPEIMLKELEKDGGRIKISYISESGTISLEGADNAGTYSVRFSFKAGSWLEDLGVVEQVEFEILPLTLKISQTQEVSSISKVYDKTSDVNFEKIKPFIVLSYGTNSVGLAETAKFNLEFSSINICDEKGDVARTARDVAYGVKLTNVKLSMADAFNKNFILEDLKDNQLIITSCIKILRKSITLENIKFNDKLYDGSVKVDFANKEEVKISGVFASDDVSIDFNKLNFEFENAGIGLNKNIIITNVSNSLKGVDKDNYELLSQNVSYEGKPSIYPYSVSVNIKGFGRVEVFNERGKTNIEYVNLIPVNAKLNVSVIARNSSDYREIYGHIESYLSGNREFAIGLRLNFVVDGQEKTIPNQLYLRLSNVSRMKEVVALTGQSTKSLSRETEAKTSTFVVDLSEIGYNLDTIIITRYRVLFKVWQIVLIVLTIVLVIVLIVTIEVIRRKRKLKKYSVNEKI